MEGNARVHIMHVLYLSFSRLLTEVVFSGHFERHIRGQPHPPARASRLYMASGRRLSAPRHHWQKVPTAKTLRLAWPPGWPLKRRRGRRVVTVARDSPGCCHPASRRAAGSLAFSLRSLSHRAPTTDRHRLRGDTCEWAGAPCRGTHTPPHKYPHIAHARTLDTDTQS